MFFNILIENGYYKKFRVWNSRILYSIKFQVKNSMHHEFMGKKNKKTKKTLPMKHKGLVLNSYQNQIAYYGNLRKIPAIFKEMRFQPGN